MQCQWGCPSPGSACRAEEVVISPVWRWSHARGIPFLLHSISDHPPTPNLCFFFRPRICFPARFLLRFSFPAPRRWAHAFLNYQPKKGRGRKQSYGNRWSHAYIMPYYGSCLWSHDTDIAAPSPARDTRLPNPALSLQLNPFPLHTNDIQGLTKHFHLSSPSKPVWIPHASVRSQPSPQVLESFTACHWVSQGWAHRLCARLRHHALCLRLCERRRSYTREI